MAVFVSVIAVLVAVGCLLAIMLSDIKDQRRENDDA